MRPSKRNPDELRRVSIERAVSMHAEGSCLIKFGNTHVLLHGEPGRAAAALAQGPRPRLGHGRVRHAAARHQRAARAARSPSGHASGRTQEIQRLIGRSLRAVVDLPKLGERQISIDCDVIQADGGTRTAAITGAWVALHDCLKWMQTRDMIKEGVLRDHVAAVSCGLYKGSAGAGPRLPGGFRRRRGRQLRHDRLGRHRRGAGHGRNRAVLAGELRPADGAGPKGIAELVALQKLTVT